jgi:hypothetical protein
MLPVVVGTETPGAGTPKMKGPKNKTQNKTTHPPRQRIPRLVIGRARRERGRLQLEQRKRGPEEGAVERRPARVVSTLSRLGTKSRKKERTNENAGITRKDLEGN